MSELSVVIVDDEPLARRGVAVRLQRRPEFKIVAECASGDAAVSAITSSMPDVVFLDVNLPDMTGLQVLRESVPPASTNIIFLTAFQEYALRAFEHGAVDYLLKPIDDARFDQALERVLRMHRLASKDESESGSYPSVDSPRSGAAFIIERFAIKTGTRVSFVEASAVDWIEAQDDYAALHVGRKVHLMRCTLSELMARLHPQRFLRIHRSAIVQVDRIVHVKFAPNGDGVVTLSDGSLVRVSRTFNRPLRRLIRRLGRR